MNNTTTRSIIMTIALLLGMLSPAVAYAQKGNSSETNPTPTAEVTRRERESSQTRLRGEGEWGWINYESGDYMAAIRYDMESSFAAEYMVDMFGDPDMLENELDMYYEDDFRVSGQRDCEGVEMYDPGSDTTVFIAICPDGRYVNLVMGTDKSDVIDAIGDMQDGYVPNVDGYVDAD